jgi:hypothetical protein
MTVIIVVLVTLVAIAAILWWALDIDVSEVVIGAAAPVAGVALIYWYWTLWAWFAGALLLAVGGLVAYAMLRKRTPKGGA